MDGLHRAARLNSSHFPDHYRTAPGRTPERRPSSSAGGQEVMRYSSVPPMNPRLKDKIAIVTGAGSGIGRACALALIREGARVVLVGRRKDRIEDVAHEREGAAMAVAADVSKQADIAQVIERTVNDFGGENDKENKERKKQQGK